MIEIKGISKSFKTASGVVKALDDVSINVSDGDILGIVGSSGAGKSTFVRCINLLERPDCGDILIDGKSLMKMEGRHLQKQRSEIGMVFQHFNLMSQRTIFKNVAFPLEYKGLPKQKVKEKVFSLLELVGISDKAKAYPSQLSGGQKQRVAIARALAADPKLLLCDEATSALDPETTKSILRLLKDINRTLNLSILVITHEKDVVKEICNKVVVLSGGKVCETGSVVDIFTYPKTEAGKAFVGNILENDNVKEALSLLSKNGHKEKLYRLVFLGEKSGDPYISTMAKKFSVYASILFGDIDVIQGYSIGNLIVKMDGGKEDTQAAISYLKENNIIVEELF